MKTLKSIAFGISLLALSLAAAAAPVDVNSADAEALASALTGVGPKVAAAIVDYRRANGPFKEVADLTKVKGIGPRILERNRPNITLGGAAKAASKTR